MSGSPEQPQRPRAGAFDGRALAIGTGAAVLVLAVAAIAFAAGGGFSPRTIPAQVGPIDADWQHGSRARDFARGHGRDLPGPQDFRFRRQLGQEALGRIVATPITISAIAGSDLTLETADGWTRTITITEETTLTRAGETISLSDLQVGDEVRLRERRNDDGSYTVTAIAVVLRHVAGEVTATTADTITVKERDGSSTTIHVDSETTYRVRGVEDATLADITVGMLLAAQGTENADGSLQAVTVYATAKR